MMTDVTKGSRWRHYNGAEYVVTDIANTESKDPRYPPTVVYRGTVNQLIWCRPLKDWHRSMTRIELLTD